MTAQQLQHCQRQTSSSLYSPCQCFRRPMHLMSASWFVSELPCQRVDCQRDVCLPTYNYRLVKGLCMYVYMFIVVFSSDSTAIMLTFRKKLIIKTAKVSQKIQLRNFRPEVKKKQNKIFIRGGSVWPGRYLNSTQLNRRLRTQVSDTAMSASLTT